VAAYGTAADLYFTGAGVQRVMDRLMPGRVASIVFMDRAGGLQQVDFSLQGLTKALIWIDTEQGRLGSERVAEAPPIGLTPVGADGAPLVDVPDTLWDRHYADGDCAPMQGALYADAIVVDRAIGDGMALYILPCWAGPGTIGARAYLEAQPGRFSLLALPEYGTGHGFTATTHVLNPIYDPASRELSTSFVREGGTCGIAGRYVWQPHDFRLVEFREQTDCTAESAELPQVYPVAAN